MARRRQLKGVAGNLVQWCLSRNFDNKGYWAVGQLYAHAKANQTDELTVELVNNHSLESTLDIEFSSSINLMRCIFQKDIGSLKIPNNWVKSAQVIFRFNTEYIRKYHFWSSALGGEPAIVRAMITTDQEKIYTKESGCNVWVHDPLRELRRCRFES